MMDPTPRPGRAATRHSSPGNQSADAAERALFALVSTGDRYAMDQLYILYFARLAKFFQNMTVCAYLVEELINDTMFEVWKERASVGTTASVSLAIMRLAYSRVHKHFVEARPNKPRFRRDVQDTEPSRSLLTTEPPSNLQVLLSKLYVEERAVMHFVYASGCSRQEIADVMRITGDRVDVLLSDARASAQQHFSVTSARSRGIDPRA
jgi:RNA polymerase sigma factor (sigma-70 family)